MKIQLATMKNLDMVILSVRFSSSLSQGWLTCQLVYCWWLLQMGVTHTDVSWLEGHCAGTSLVHLSVRLSAHLTFLRWNCRQMYSLFFGQWCQHHIFTSWLSCHSFSCLVSAYVRGVGTLHSGLSDYTTYTRKTSSALLRLITSE